MKFFLVLAALLALSSASHLFYGKKDYSDFPGIFNKDLVQGEGLYGKYPGLGWLYGQQQGLGYQRYAPFFQGRQNVYDYYGNNDYYGNKDYYYGNQDFYYGNKDYYYGNKDTYYGDQDYYYGNKDYHYDNIDTTHYFNPLLNQVARQGFYNQYENIIPYNYEYYNQIPSIYQHLYKGYYPLQYSYGKGYGYGYGHNYPSTYQYGRQYEPVVPRQIAY